MSIKVGNDGKIYSLNSASASSICLANGGVYIINPKVLHPYKDQLGCKMSLEDDIIVNYI